MFGSQTEKKSPQPPQPDKPPVQQATAPKSSPAKTVHQEVKPPVISVPKDEVKVESKEEEEFQGLPRPADYDDFWYEGEDGEWYNEYDDQLEEGQLYQEVPEEEGYPKPDLSEVPQPTPQPTPEPQPASPVPVPQAATEQQKPPQQPPQPKPPQKAQDEQKKQRQQVKPPPQQPAPQQTGFGGMIGGLG